MPNLAAWAVSLFGLGGALAMLLGRRDRRPGSRRDRALAAALLGTWSVLFLSDVILATHRVMYLYHYFLPLVIGWILAALTVRHVRVPSFLGTAAMASVLANFLLISPFALHRPMSDRECAARAILNGRFLCEHKKETPA